MNEFSMPGLDQARRAARPRVTLLEDRVVPALIGVNPVMHIHATLSIFVDGQPVTVPADIGVSPTVILPVHTHDTSGRIHVESVQTRDFPLQDLFDAWGQSLSSERFLGYAVGADRSLTMTVNGASTSALGTWILHDHDDIVLRLNRRQQPPVNTSTSARPVLAAHIVHSSEYYQNLVRDYYQDYLGRTPDGSGLAFWSGLMQQGLPAEQAEALLLGSPEYVARQGGAGRPWVEAVYQELLGRSPDGAGLEFWIDRVEDGSDTTLLTRAIAGSAERWGRHVVDFYTEHLDRTPGQGEVDFWVGVGLAGMRVEDLEATFVDSPEYFNHPRRGNGNTREWVRSAYQSLLHRGAGEGEATFWLSIVEAGQPPAAKRS